MAYEMAAINVLLGRKPYVGASDEACEEFRQLGLAVVARAMHNLHTLIMVQGKMTGLLGGLANLGK